MQPLTLPLYLPFSHLSQTIPSRAWVWNWSMRVPKLKEHISSFPRVSSEDDLLSRLKIRWHHPSPWGRRGEMCIHSSFLQKKSYKSSPLSTLSTLSKILSCLSLCWNPLSILTDECYCPLNFCSSPRPIPWTISFSPKVKATTHPMPTVPPGQFLSGLAFSVLHRY